MKSDIHCAGVRCAVGLGCPVGKARIYGRLAPGVYARAGWVEVVVARRRDVEDRVGVDVALARVKVLDAAIGGFAKVEIPLRYNS